MTHMTQTFTRPATHDLSALSVLRKTYFLLSLTLLFCAGCAYQSMSLNFRPNFIILLVGMYGLYFLTMKLRNSKWGVASIFAYTGFMGFILGPILNLYIKGYSNGPQMVSTAAGATGALFLGLSFYTVIKRKDYSYLGGFLFAAILMAAIGMIFNLFFNIPMLQVLVSGAFAVISCGYILYTTSRIIQGGERNYIMATISLFIAIFNLFISLLQLLAIFGGGRR